MSQFPASFLCPITSELMADPVSTRDGFSYEREAIAEWFASGQQTSPMTGAPLDRAELLPNHALRAAIQQYVEEHPDAARELYCPRGTDALRQTIGAKQWAAPQPAPANDGAAPLPVEQAIPVLGAEEAVPCGLPVAEPSSYAPVQPPPPAPLAALTKDDAAAAAPHAVSDWEQLCARLQASARQSSSRGGGSSWNPFKSRSGESTTSSDADEPTLRAHAADGGGVALEATVDCEAKLCRLGLRLAAAASAPLAELRITWHDSAGHGANQPMAMDDSHAFALFARALRAASDGDGACLRGLRSLAISKLTIGDGAALTLSDALRGHPSLASLELWNVGLEDAGALRIGRLAARDGNAALAQLNLGRNLFSGEARELLEGMVDASRVRAKMY